jgi:hypothetical protein
MSETRVDRLETELHEIKEAVVRIEATLNATLPHLATKAELTTGLSDLRAEIADLRTALVDKPGKVYLATAIGVLLVAYTAGLAGLAALPVVAKLVQ